MTQPSMACPAWQLPPKPAQSASDAQAGMQLALESLGTHSALG